MEFIVDILVLVKEVKGRNFNYIPEKIAGKLLRKFSMENYSNQILSFKNQKRI